MKKTAVIYWSGTGNTKQMAEAVLEGMKSAGAEAALLEAATGGRFHLQRRGCRGLRMPRYGV